MGQAEGSVFRLHPFRLTGSPSPIDHNKSSNLARLHSRLELCCCLCYGNYTTLRRMQATLRFALRWQVWPPRTRLRLIRLQMRWNRDLVPRGEA
jgi:hypothetical protein